MAGVGGVPRARGLAIVAALFTLGIAAPVAAADEEPVVLATDALANMVADLDGDGDREVLAVRRHPDDDERLVVEAWGMVGDEWASIGSSPLERWDAVESAPQPARFGQEGYGMLALRNGPRTRAIVATVTEDFDDIGGGCCLSLSVIGIGEAGLSVDLIDAPLGTAESLQVADLDADGTDELVVSRTLSFDNITGLSVMEHAIVRQVGDGFELQPVALSESEALYLAVVGETDGVPGDDLLFIAQDANELVRVVDDGGMLRSEVATPIDDRAFPVWPAGVGNGLIVFAEERRVTIVRWPRDGQATTVVSNATSSYPAIIPLGSGPGLRWVDLGEGGPNDVSFRVLDEDLNVERTIDVGPLTDVLRELNESAGRIPQTDRYLWEQVGPIPGGLGMDRHAMLGYGRLVAIDADGTLEVRPAAHLAGVAAVGVAGPEGEWLAVSGEWFGWNGSVFLGNIGYEPPYGMVGVIPMSALLSADASRTLAVELHGVTVADQGAADMLFTSGDDFQVTVRGAPGDLVVVNNDRRITIEPMPDGGTLTLTIDPPGSENRNREFDLSILLLGSTGLTRGVSWQAEALRVAPEVTATAAVETFAMQAAISGQTAPDATLTVDGVPVTPTPSGHFSVEVDAPIWPRDVLVVSRDAVGNETVQRLEIIGFLDYRGLPWIPIVGILTVVAGIVLFVRTPRLRPEERLRPDGDGRLEEIDGDLI